VTGWDGVGRPAESGGVADLVIHARRVVTPEGVRPAGVWIRDGVITAVTAWDGSPTGAGLLPGSSSGYISLPEDEVLMPGLVDTHVHVNEPGRTDWEGFATATAAAAAGGVTTIIDMPLNSVPPTTDLAALELKRAAAAGQCAVDVGFWGGAVPANVADRPALRDAGVFGFKCFMVDSGVPEFPPLDDQALTAAMRQLAELGSLLIVHAEDAACIKAAPVPSGSNYADFLRSRPPAAEVAAIIRVLRLAVETGVRVHVLHLSSADPVPLLAAAREYGAQISAETARIT
jgi:allantoinase